MQLTSVSIQVAHLNFHLSIENEQKVNCLRMLLKPFSCNRHIQHKPSQGGMKASCLDNEYIIFFMIFKI